MAEAPRPTDAELLAELGPLAAVIADKLRTVPVRHGPGGTDDLISELTLAVAVYVGRHVLPAEALELRQPSRPADEDPARIDRLRPEFTEHSSVEAIDAQLKRARAQERRWHLRTEWLVSLRATRVTQKARGEWPGGAADTETDGACTNCLGSGLDPRYNGEFACPDCPADAGARQPKEA